MNRKQQSVIHKSHIPHLQITRRDFLGGSLLGAGTALLGGLTPAQLLQAGADQYTAAAPVNLTYDGPSGVGDYRGNNGNTWDVVTRAHAIFENQFDESAFNNAHASDDDYDVVIIGGGATSMGAAYRIKKDAPGTRMLILENHRIFGGEAKHNEYHVNGHRIFGPQGSNLVILPRYSGQMAIGDDLMFDEFNDIGMPLSYDWVELEGTDKPLEFDVTNYAFTLWATVSDSIGYYPAPTADNPRPDPVRNPFMNGMRGLGFDEKTRNDFLRYNWSLSVDHDRADMDRWLDRMSYEELLVDVHGLSPAVARFCDPLLASALGFGSATCSAYVATKLLMMPGAAETPESGEYRAPVSARHLTTFMRDFNVGCFPGGNTYVYRYLMNYVWPGLFEGENTPASMMGGKIRFDELENRNNNMHMRLAATVVDVRHLKGSNGDRVRVVYERNGELHQVVSKTAIVCAGAWVSRHILGDAPPTVAKALDKFDHSPVVAVNVALTNWRFMERMGLTSVLYFGGKFGFYCNIRQPLVVGDYGAPFHPDKPIVLTFYAPMIDSALPARQQGLVLRQQLLATPYMDIERRVIEQMQLLFDNGGFEPQRDIAAITVNRWGHAYSVPKPGFFYPADNSRSATDTLREGYGRIFFAHAELRGLQAFVGAMAEGQRAAQQAIDLI